jgi:hypothetical protein
MGWEGLDAKEQASVSACVDYLRSSGRIWGIPIAPTSRAREWGIYESCGSSMRGDPTSCSMRLIHAGARCF